MMIVIYISDVCILLKNNFQFNQIENDEVSQKRFSDFSETSLIISFFLKKPNLAVKRKRKSYF